MYRVSDYWFYLSNARATRIDALWNTSRRNVRRASREGGDEAIERDGDGDGDASTVVVRDDDRRCGGGVRRRRGGRGIGEVRRAEGARVGHREG